MLGNTSLGGVSIMVFLFISENLKESYLTGVWLKSRERVKEISIGHLVAWGLKNHITNMKVRVVCLFVILIIAT